MAILLGWSSTSDGSAIRPGRRPESRAPIRDRICEPTVQAGPVREFGYQLDTARRADLSVSSAPSYRTDVPVAIMGPPT